MARITPCNDEDFCHRNLIVITKNMSAGVFGRAICNKSLDEKDEPDEESYQTCCRPALLRLHIQERILRFLHTCTNIILHDMSVEEMRATPIMSEPALTELLEHDNDGQTSFSNILMTAPYRGWHSQNFAKLREYITGALDTQKEHFIALHEDPSYFADTLRVYEDHMYCPKAEKSKSLSVKRYHRNQIIASIVKESYSKVASWQELHRRFSDFDRLFQENADVHDQVHAVSEVEKIAESMKGMLSHELAVATLSSPKIRKSYQLSRDPETSEPRVTPNETMSNDQKLLLKIIEYFLKPEKIYCLPAMLSWSLETIDLLLRKAPECKAMMSPRILSLLTDLSILAECLRQINVWENSPEVRMCQHPDCEYILDLSEFNHFRKWVSNIEGFAFTQGYVYPYQEKLYYPIHKRQTREHTRVMRLAEENLDKFWAEIEASFESKTGISRYSVIQSCLDEGGEMYRTAPWVEPAKSRVELTGETKQAYHPFPSAVHDKTTQITGAFDRLVLEMRSKIKTRGTSDRDVAAQNHDPTDHTHDGVAHESSLPFLVDKRTHKVFKAIFHAPLKDDGDTPKAVKWAEFRRAMARVGFAVEKLQGSAWQFTPGETSNAERNIQFHEPHPDSDVPYAMAKRFGRRLGRVYGWSIDTFKLA
jgi:hypothetical protein